jgi:hypothetical protein
MMNKFKFGGLDKPGIYLDETVMRMCYTHRRAFAQLALRLLQEGKTDKVAKLIDYAEQVISPENVPHNYPSGSLDLARVSLRVKKADHAINLSRAVAQGACEYIEWYLSLPTSILLRDDRDCMYYMYQLHAAAEVLKEANCDEAKTFEERLEGYNRSLQSRLEGMDLGI